MIIIIILHSELVLIVTLVWILMNETKLAWNQNFLSFYFISPYSMKKKSWKVGCINAGVYVGHIF